MSETEEKRQPPIPPESSRDGKGTKTTGCKRSLPMADDSGRTPKRPREDDLTNVDKTPQAQLTRPPHPSLPVSQSESESVSTSLSRDSDRSSPPEQLAALELGADGIETRALSPNAASVPLSLRSLLAEIGKCANGWHILSEEMKAAIDERKRRDEFGEFAEAEDSWYIDAPTRRRLGPVPSLQEAAELVEDAARCQTMSQNEAGWNMMVHYPVLKKAIGGRNRRTQLVDFAPCTTAAIIPEYLPSRSQAKMVDFCLCIDLGKEPSEFPAEAIHELRQILPCNAINHTDYLPFRNRPIVVSIKTEKRGTGQEDAEKQIMTWHAAQWNFLQERVAEAGTSMDGLDFLPAIVVQGHDWKFVATTREDRKTVLWLDKYFGSTTDSLGVYKIVWVLQRLAQWCEDVYWVWYKRNVL